MTCSSRINPLPMLLPYSQVWTILTAGKYNDKKSNKAFSLKADNIREKRNHHKIKTKKRKEPPL